MKNLSPEEKVAHENADHLQALLGKAEIVNNNPAQQQLNFQLALTRLVLDVDERNRARLDGKAFQAKYNLTNQQMLALLQIAIWVGEYKDPGKSELDQLMKAFR